MMIRNNKIGYNLFFQAFFYLSIELEF